MNMYSLPAIISFAVNFSLAFIVLMDKPQAALNRWFAAFIFSFALWNLSEVIILNSAHLAMVQLGAQILYRLIFLAPAFYVIVSYLFPKNFHRWAAQPFFYIAVFSLPVLLLSLSFPDFQIQIIPLKKFPDIYYYHFKYSFKPLFNLLLVVGVSYMMWGSIVLINKIPRLRTVRQKNQARFFVTGMIIIFFIFLLINFLRPIFEGTVSFYFLSTFLTLIIAVFFFIAIVQFHWFKPARLISGSVTYTVLSAFILAVYFLIIREISNTLEHFFRVDSYIFDTFIILTLVFLILPFEKRLEGLIDRLLNKEHYNFRKHFLNFLRDVQTYYEPPIFFEKITKFLARLFKSEQVYIFVLQPQSQYFVTNNLPDQQARLPLRGKFVQELKHRKRAIEFYEIEPKKMDNATFELLESLHTRIILPLIFENDLLAIIILTQKKFGLEYSEEELDVLSIFASEMAASLRRNQMIEQLRRRDRQQFQLEKLAAIGQLTAGIAHEIRNPLNTISTSAETLLNKSLAPGDQDELKRFILEESNRLNRILTDFLNFSRLKPARFIAIEMSELLERLCLNLQRNGNDDIDLNFIIEPDAGIIFTDPDLLMQALLNLGLNGLEAIYQRCREDADFSCDQGLLQCRVGSDGENFILTIKDNGVGIPDTIREFIYNPFYTTKENGTGLGLSIVHNIIETLSGQVDFVSQKGQTVFTIKLPKNLYSNEAKK